MEEIQQENGVLTLLHASTHWCNDIGYLFEPLGESTVLEETLRRVKAAKWGKRFTLLTTLSDEDYPLRKFCWKHNIAYVAHSNSNSLEAMLTCARLHSASIVVRCYANQTFLSPRMLDASVSWALSSEMDYVVVSRLPVGVPAEAFSIHTLERLAQRGMSLEEAQKKHLLQRDSPDFDCAYLPAPLHWRRPELRFTLENAGDYDAFQQIYAEVPQRQDGLHAFEDLLLYLDRNPSLKRRLQAPPPLPLAA